MRQKNRTSYLEKSIQEPGEEIVTFGFADNFPKFNSAEELKDNFFNRKIVASMKTVVKN